MSLIYYNTITQAPLKATKTKSSNTNTIKQPNKTSQKVSQTTNNKTKNKQY